ncbi:MAG TPA: hypothetical protein VKF42_11195 [Chitinivibrionales bacterium]|nr:hypothetical protein [Chitinivibrionales bacterium]
MHLMMQRDIMVIPHGREKASGSVLRGGKPITFGKKKELEKVRRKNIFDGIAAA